MVAWPDSLPRAPLVAGLSAEKQDNKLTFRPEVGDDKVRRRFTATMKDFGATFVLKSDGKAALDAFHDDTLVDGTLTFSFTDPDIGGYATFRFLAPPAWTRISAVTWRAECRLRRVP